MRSKVVLGVASAAELREWAVRALSSGDDTPSLRMLAGSTASDDDGVMDWFERSSTELGVQAVSRVEAVHHLAMDMARHIQEERMTAIEGARRIWALTVLVPEHRFDELGPFIYSASEWDERPEEHEMITGWILAAAADFLAGA
jgi:hypothetical protein